MTDGRCEGTKWKKCCLSTHSLRPFIHQVGRVGVGVSSAAVLRGRRCAVLNSPPGAKISVGSTSPDKGSIWDRSTWLTRLRERAVAIKTQQTDGIVKVCLFIRRALSAPRRTASLPSVDFGFVVGECRIEMRREGGEGVDRSEQLKLARGD